MLKQIAGRFTELFRGPRLDRESAAELAHHIELEVAIKIDAGLDPAEARRQTRLELGDPEGAREQLREGRLGFHLDMFSKDLTLAARTLGKNRVFFGVCVLTIGLGVGASTALFALVDAVVLRPLPLPEPSTLVRIYDTNTAQGMIRGGITSGNLLDWRRRATKLRGISGNFVMGRTLTGGPVSEVVLAAQVTEDFFGVLGVPAALGRTFTPEETRASLFNNAAAPIGVDPVVVISHGLWQTRFAGDPGVLGQSLIIDRRSFRIVGVMPPAFAMPAPGVQVFMPWGLPEKGPRDQHYVQGIARLAPGATLTEAEGELRLIAKALGAEYPESNEGWSVSFVPLHEDMVGDSGVTLFVLLAAVGLVLLVACANVALLSLARGLERVHEASIRLALGATRGRLVAQCLVEALVISSAGGLLGSALAFGAIEWLKRAGTDVPRLQEVYLDPRALLFSCAASGLAALISGLPSAWRRSQARPSPDLLGTPTRVAGSGRRTVRDALVVAEVALAVVLLAGATLLVRSYQHLRSVDPGFNPEGVLVAPIFLDMQSYGGRGKALAYYQTLIERLEALPGVTSAGGATALPASPLGPDFERPVWPESAPVEDGAKRQAWVRMITPRYFETLGMKMVSGRPFDKRDGPDGAATVIVSEGVARKHWPGRDPVGQRLVIDYSMAGTYPYEVVGVVNDVRFKGPRTEPRQEIYLAHAQRPYLVLNIAVRASGDVRHLAPAVRRVLHELDAGKPAQGLHTLEDLLGATYARDRHAMLILTAFATVAVLLSLLGVHGMLSHLVRERRREIGIRMAIGANRRHLLGWIAKQGLQLSLAGVLLGALIAMLSGRAISSLLFGVPLTDPAALLAFLALPFVVLLVSLHPAWRATRIHPADVLRTGV